jgi:hypothetical protein
LLLEGAVLEDRVGWVKFLDLAEVVGLSVAFELVFERFLAQFTAVGLRVGVEEAVRGFVPLYTVEPPVFQAFEVDELY